jgi:hypothetical protein
MRLFFQTLEGDVCKWFRELPTSSIDSWQVLKYAFMKQWGEKRYIMYYLTTFASLKKKENYYVVDFNKSFNKLYKNIPRDINPLWQAAKVTCVGDFDADFSMVLRERRDPILLIM